MPPFTSCLHGDNKWGSDASEIRQYVKEEYAEMWHARSGAWRSCLLVPLTNTTIEIVVVLA